MKVNEGMKKLLSLLLAFTMVLSYVPMNARAEESCPHHVHDESCGYVEAVKGSDCAHQCTDSCVTVDVTNCIHDHEAEGCPYTPAVEAAACDYVHGEGCGHVYAQDEVPCTCGGVSVHADGCASLLTEGAECDCTPTLTHAEGCEPRDAVAESCSHVHGDCAYREAAGESWDCDHVCTVDTGCIKAVCTHVCPEGDCGFVQAVAGSDCTFECTACKAEDEPVNTSGKTVPQLKIKAATSAAAKITGAKVLVNGTEQTGNVINFTEEDELTLIFYGENFDKLGSSCKYRFGPYSGSIGIYGSFSVDTTVTPHMASRTFTSSQANHSFQKSISYTNPGETETVVYTLNYVTEEEPPAPAVAKVTGAKVLVNDTEQTGNVINYTDGDALTVIFYGENFDKLVTDHKYRVGPTTGNVGTYGFFTVDTTVNPHTATKTFPFSQVNSSTQKNISYTNPGETETVVYTLNYVTEEEPPAPAVAKITGVKALVNGTEQAGNVINYTDGDELTLIFSGENFDKLVTDHKYRVGSTTGNVGTYGFFTVDTTVNPHTATKTFSQVNSSTQKNISYTNPGETETVVYTLNYVTEEEPPAPAVAKITGVKALLNGQEQQVGEVIFTDGDELTVIFSGENFDKLSTDYKYKIGSASGSVTNYGFFTIDTESTPNTASKTISSTTLQGSKNKPICYTNAGESEVVTGYTLTYQKPVTTYTVTVTADPTAGGTVTGGGTYEEGDKVSLTATPAEDYKFVNWTENGSVVSTNAAYTFTVTGNRTLVANFEEKPLEITLSIGTAYTNTITEMYRGDNGTMYCTFTFSKPDPVGRMHMYVDGVKKNASWNVKNITGTTLKKTRSTATNLKIGENTVKFEFVPSGSTESYFTNEIVVTMHKIDSTRLLKHISNHDKAVVVEYDEEKAVEVKSIYEAGANTLYLGPEDYTITYWKDGVSTTAPTEPGVYTVTISIHGNDYYEKMDDVPLAATLTINPPPHTHDWSYSASGDTVTATCLTDSSHTFTATLEAENATYSGTAITTASISYPENWPGEKPTEISYSDNVNAGAATAQITVEGQKLTANFAIAPYNISGENITVTLNPTSGTYTGKKNKPEVIVKFHDTELNPGTDYGCGWSGNLINPDTYTLIMQGIDNFTGVNDTVTYTIGKAELTNVSVSQTKTLTYNGQPQTPEVNASASSQGSQKVTFTYSTAPEGTYGDLPSFTNAGTYTVYYKASAQYHDDATGSFTVTVNKQEVTPPAIAGKVYNGQKQTADVPASDLYAVTMNNGGTDGGEYPVVLSLKDNNNYKWPDSEQRALTLKFTITPADNAWVTEPTITGWTYGNAPSTPAMGEPVYGKATTSVSYVGTTNAGTAYESTEAPTAAGDYKAVFTVPATGSYVELKKEVPFTVKRAVPTVSGLAYTEPNLTYNGQEQFVGVTTGMEGVEANNIFLNYSAVPKNAGDYTFTVSVAQTDNYEAANLTSDEWKFTINKAEPVISWDVTEFTYNAQPQGEAKVTLVNNEVYSGTISYFTTISENLSRGGLPTDAGTYTVHAAIAAQDNYLVTDSEATIVIKAKEITPTVELSEDSVTYDGEAHEPAVKVMDGDTVIPADEYTVSYSSNVEVGKASVTIRDANDGNYTVKETTVCFLILPDTTELDKLDEDTVTSDDAETIQDILDSIQPEDLEGISDEAKAEWDAIAEKCEDLQDAVDQAEDAADAVTDTVTEIETDKPTTDDLEELEKILEDYKASEGNMTEEEKAAVAEDVKKLEDKIEDLQQTKEKVEDIQETLEELEEKDLTYDDKETIQDVLEDIEEALEKDENLSASDKFDLNENKKAAEDLLKEFEEADKVTEQLNKLPESADPDDEKAIEDYEKTLEAYEKLGKDQTKVDPDAAKRLEKLNKALTDYKIIKGNGTKWVKGSSTGLAITANGAYSKFVSVEINGRELAKSNYTVKSGSTVVILNANYLNKLKTGKYNIDINYPDGSAEGHFQIVTWDENPFTGDRIMTAVAVMSLSAAALVVLLSNKKRFKV